MAGESVAGERELIVRLSADARATALGAVVDAADAKLKDALGAVLRASAAGMHPLFGPTEARIRQHRHARETHGLSLIHI